VTDSLFRSKALRALARKLRAVRPKRAGPPAYSAVVALVFALMVVDLLVLGLLFLDPVGFSALGTWSLGTIWIFTVVTWFGMAGVYLLPVGAMLLIGLFVPVEAPRRVAAALHILWLRLLFFFTAVAGTGLFVTVLKRPIGRLRPHHLDGSAILQFDPLSWKASAASFPSGHSTTAWCVAVALGLLLGRRSWPPLAVLAVLICLSRVVLGAHFISDVVAGGLCGGLGTIWFARFLARKGLVFCISTGGALALRGSGAAKTVRAWLLSDKAKARDCA